VLGIQSNILHIKIVLPVHVIYGNAEDKQDYK